MFLMKYFIFIATVAMVTGISHNSVETIVKERNSCNTVMQLNNLNSLKIKIKISQEKLSQNYTFCSIAKGLDPRNGVKMWQKLLFLIFTNICFITKQIFFSMSHFKVFYS